MSTGSWSRGRRRALPARLALTGRTLSLRALTLRALALVGAIGALAWLGWQWYQGSSFVRVRQVTVAGLSGPDVPQIRAALTRAALGMTTMDMQVTKLESAVEAYPYVESITVTRHGAHAVTIEVSEQVPVAMVQAGGQAEVVDGRGQLLAGSAIPHGLLPLVELRSLPTGETVTATGARAAIATLAAAPYALLAHIGNATWSAQHGVIVQLRGGPQIYFGAAQQLGAKWRAAVAVLQNSASGGADYIDVSDPGRPAAGVGVSTKQAESLGLVTASSGTS